MQYITDYQDPHHHYHTTTTGKLMSPSKAIPEEQGGIKLSLVNSDLWKAFHTTGTEMVITKHGRRMFPHCNVSLSGLDPSANYVIMMDMIPVDRFKYKWNKEKWGVAGKAEPQPRAQTYVHPDSPAPGTHWMKGSVSFLRAKLTNNTLDQHGHIILHSMHQYFPRFYVVQADSTYTVHWSPYQTFSFPETHFTAVTAYQNTKMTKLKIHHNPFAKGFREGGSHFHNKRSRPSKTSNNAEETRQMDGESLCKSPAGLQRSLSAIKSAKRHCPDGQFSPWSVDQDPTESLHTDTLDLPGQDQGCEEQMVPASMAYQPYRFAEYIHPSPYSDAEDRLRGYEPHVADVATVPGHHHPHPSSRDTGHHPHTPAPVQEDSRQANANPGLHADYAPLRVYPGGHTDTDPGRPYMVDSFAHHGTADPHGYHRHHGNTAEWSQYSLFELCGTSAIRNDVL